MPLVKARKNNSKSQPARRDVPDISSDLPAILNAAELFSSAEVIVRDCLIENLSFDGIAPSSIFLENCILQRVSFTRSKLSGLKLKDVRLIECDLANAEATAPKILRTEFLNCRLIGFRMPEADCQHVLISEGDAAFSQSRFGIFKAAEFNACNFTAADLQNTDLRGAILRGCNFTKAEMTGAKLDGADFRGSRVEGLAANAEDLKGAIVDPAQAMVFAELMGLKIR